VNPRTSNASLGENSVKSPKVSVIIPCCNVAATLPAAVISVQAQNFRDLEILLVDDGSSDNTLVIARQLACDDARIRIFPQRNAGPAAARNRGIAKARGEIVAFLDANHAWAPDLLLRHLAFLGSNAQCGVSFARVCIYDPELRIAGRVTAHARRLTLARVLGEDPVCTASNVVARRDTFATAGLFDETLNRGEVQEWLARVLACTAWAVCGLPEILVKSRTSVAGSPVDFAGRHAQWAALLDKVRSYAPQAAGAAEAEATALFHRYLARHALRAGQGKSAFMPLLRALAANPAALLANQPHHTAMILAAALAAFLPGTPARGLVRK
jgi:hypothetical protein